MKIKIIIIKSIQFHSLEIDSMIYTYQFDHIASSEKCKTATFDAFVETIGKDKTSSERHLKVRNF